ncbi:MAG: hypothetical protein J6A01_09460 [Proteobacteria bacterium]|nr:hypothetical protein [Pseudomonadota bacterium]
MKKAILSCIGLLCILIMTGCGPTLKDYVRQSNNYSNQVKTTTNASVNIEESGVVRGIGKLGTVGAIVNTASNVATSALSNDQAARLNRLIEPQKVGASMADGFNHNFEGTTHLKVVGNDANPDLRIMLTVTSYGLWAESLVSTMKFFVEAEIRVVYAPEMKTIYTNGATLSRDASNIISQMANAVAGSGLNVLSLAKGAANLAALFEMTDEEIVTIFDYLSYDSGLVIATQLVDEIYR